MIEAIAMAAYLECVPTREEVIEVMKKYEIKITEEKFQEIAKVMNKECYEYWVEGHRFYYYERK